MTREIVSIENTIEKSYSLTRGIMERVIFKTVKVDKTPTTTK